MKNRYEKIVFFLFSMLLSTGIIVAQAPANDNCANAILINSDSACVVGTSQLNAQTLGSATGDGGTIASACTAVASQDVWYKFIAKTPQPTITISNLGTNWGTELKIQLLSGSCGSFTEIACANNAPVTPALTNLLTPGTTYYVRIHKNDAVVPVATNWGFSICITEPLTRGSRMGEVFSRIVLSAASVLNYPWEVTYGPDNNLWITEAQGYKMYRMNPVTGVKTKVLDLSSGSTFLPPPQDTLNAQSMGTWNPWPQGGFAGMALHPNFLDGSGNFDYVYVAYVHRFLGGSSPSGLFYRNKLVRFTYNSGTGLLGSPTVLCDTLPGSKDHNSQRMIIAPVVKGGTNYLFYGSGDMGAGQFENRTRTNNAQNPNSYEGKILRFNLVTDGDPGMLGFIPNSNPYSSTSAVYSLGMRNNQGFAYDTSTNTIYGAAHGPYSDDEINIIQPFTNYGHPLVIGYADGNYNGNAVQGTSTSYSAGAPFTDANGVSSCPPVGNETTRMNALIASAGTLGTYKSPLFSAYPTPAATIANTWTTNPGNNNWYSEAWSGLDLYSNKIIPDWKRSLVAAGLKWGRLIRLRLGATGVTTLPSNLDSANVSDTVTYFQSTNRYRDLAFSPNGKEVYLVMDNSSATSGPGVGNPTVPACPGCVIKYSFVGYGDAGGFSTISKTIPVTSGTAGTVNTGTTVTIDGSNNFLWVPITGADGNILAEINAAGQNLGTVTASFYKNSGAIRVAGCVHYLDRNIQITASNSFVSPVKVRLYIAKTEYDALAADPLSGVTAIGQLRVLQNADACAALVASATSLLIPTNTLVADLTHGANGYVLQVNVTTLSSFYFGGSNITSTSTQLIWTGTTNSTWNTGTNWNCGFVPGPTDDIIIPSGGTQPVLPANTAVHNISLAGVISLNGFNLTVNGAISGAGTITGSSTSGLIIGGAAGTLNFTTTTAATRSLDTLILNSGASATLGSALDVYKSIDLTSATLNLNAQNLTLKSNAAGTARIGNLTGSTLTGATSVTVERYIPAKTGPNYASWRILSVPTSGQTIKQSWMENQAANANGNPGYGTRINSTTGTGAGYDAASGGNGLLNFNPATNAWIYPGATSTAIATNSGHMVYIRGSRAVAPGFPANVSDATIMRTTGTIYQGDQTAIPVAATKFSLIGNVYASAIDFGSITGADKTVDDMMWVWDPKLGTTGGYQTFTPAGGGNYTVTPGGGSYPASPYRNVESGQAFFVHATGAGSITLREAHKTTGSREVQGPSTGPGMQLRTNIYGLPTTANYLVDGVLNRYDDNFSNAVDQYDARKLTNFTENLSTMRDGISLSVENRKIISVKDTIFFKLAAMNRQEYQLEFKADNMNRPGLSGTLEDSYLNSRIPIDLNGVTNLNFTVDGNPASAGADRFRIVFKMAATVPITKLAASQQISDIAATWNTVSEIDMARYELERSTDGSMYNTLNKQYPTGNNGGTFNYNWMDNSPVVGDNYYRVKSVGISGDFKYSNIVTVNFGRGTHAITVYPNPVTDGVITVQFRDMAKGIYTISLLNNSGQVMNKEQFEHGGGSALKNFILSKGTSKGSYRLEIRQPDGSLRTQQIMIQ